MSFLPGTGKTGSGLHLGRVKLATAYYDFAEDGGAVGAITLRGDKVPSGAIVLNAVVDVTTAVTSGGAATVAIHAQSAADLRAADVLATAPALSTATPKALLAPIKTTAERDITATVATAALTAGAFTVTVAYIEVA